MPNNTQQSIKIDKMEKMLGRDVDPSQWLTGDVLTDDELPLMDENRSMEDLSQIDSAICVQSSQGSVISDIDLLTKQMENNEELQIKMKATIDELDEFLIRNDSTEDAVVTKDDKEGEKDDGNDTDELLRMLGEDGTAPKKHVLKKKQNNNKTNYESDDDDDGDDDVSKDGRRGVVHTTSNSNIHKRKRQKVNGHKQHNERSGDEIKNKMSKKKNNTITNIISTNKDNNKCTTVRELKRQLTHKEKKVDSCDEEINETEFLEDDDFDLDDKLVHSDVASVSDGEQMIRKPEMMDEEVLSDCGTDDEDDYSFYDGLPSSDSENVDEWFDLDLRTEQAGEYLPLLGDDAEELLLTEKDNVKGRIKTLKLGLESITKEISVKALELEKKRQRLVKLDALLSQV